MVQNPLHEELGNNTIQLYSKEDPGKPTSMVVLSDEGYAKYKKGEPWNSEWVTCVMDCSGIAKADFS